MLNMNTFIHSTQRRTDKFAEWHRWFKKRLRSNVFLFYFISLPSLVLTFAWFSLQWKEYILNNVQYRKSEVALFITQLLPISFHRRSSFSAYNYQHANGICKCSRTHHNCSLPSDGTRAHQHTNQTCGIACWWIPSPICGR